MMAGDWVTGSEQELLMGESWRRRNTELIGHRDKQWGLWAETSGTAHRSPQASGRSGTKGEVKKKAGTRPF